MNILWEWIWPAWLVLCWILQVSKKDPLRGLSAHAYVGMAIYLPLRLSVIYCSDPAFMQHKLLIHHFPAMAFALGVIVQVAMFVWLMSPGTMPFLLAPFRVLLVSKGCDIQNRPPLWTNDSRMWTRSSILVTVIVIIFNILVFGVFRYLRG